MLHARPSLGSLGANSCGSSRTFFLTSTNLASPCSSEFLGKFQGLQRAINSYLRKFSLRFPIGGGDDAAVVKVDGEIGPRTMSALDIVFTHASENNLIVEPDIEEFTARSVASNVDAFTASVSAGSGIPSNKTPNPATRKTAGPVSSPKKSALSLGVIALAAAAGLVTYKLTSDEE